MNTISSSPDFEIKYGFLTKYRGQDADVVIPNSVTDIEQFAFMDCSSLKSINIPNSVTKIGEASFWGCSSLKSISIPDSITEVSEATFSGCSSLKEVSMAENTSVSASAFQMCKSVPKIIRRPST